MSRLRAASVAVLLSVALAAGTATSQEGAGPPADARSTVLLLLDCRSDIGRREITLFANGTVRLRQGPPNEEIMRLGELDPDALDAYLARLAEEDLAEALAVTDDVDGEWVERCLLEMPPIAVLRSSGPYVRPEPEIRRYTFSRYSVLPNALSRVVSLAEELVDEVRQNAGGGFPSDYRPRRGDVLERVDGVLFEVVGVTRDQGGIELAGLESPLILYVPVDALQNDFVALVRRRGERP